MLCPPGRPRQVRDGGVTCWSCIDGLRSVLVEIAERFVAVTARPGGGMAAGRRAPGFFSSPPVNLHNATLRDPRTVPTRLGELHSPLHLVLTWSNYVRAGRGQTPATHPAGRDAAVVAVEVRYLVDSLDWITRQAFVTLLAEQARAVRSQLRSARGERRPRPLARCTATIGDDAAVCGHPLFPPRSVSRPITCGSCGARYDAATVLVMRADETAA